MEFDHRYLDYFVLGHIEAGGIEIDDDADFDAEAVWRGGGLSGNETAQDLIVTCQFELAGELFGGERWYFAS